MKKLIWVLIIVLLLGLGFQNRQIIAAKTTDILYQSPCDTPKEYRIGTIDARFNISQGEFASAIHEAAETWNSAYGKPLFAYNADGAMPISLVFDERQSLNTEINHLNDEL